MKTVLVLGLWAWAGSDAARAQAPETPVRGHWALGVSVGTWSFGTASKGTDSQGDPLWFMPYRPTMWGFGAQYGGEGLRLGVTVRYGRSGLGAQGEQLSENGERSNGPLLVFDDAYRLVAWTATVSDRIARIYGGPSLRGTLGLGIERWSSPGESGRTIVGAQGGLGLEVPLSRIWVATVAGEVGFTPASPFRLSHLPNGFRTQSTWRRALTATVEWRF